MGHGEPRTLTCVTIFFSPSSLVPAPHVEQNLRRFSLQTSQFIPQAPVGMINPYNGRPLILLERVNNPGPEDQVFEFKIKTYHSTIL